MFPRNVHIFKTRQIIDDCNLSTTFNLSRYIKNIDQQNINPLPLNDLCIAILHYLIFIAK